MLENMSQRRIAYYNGSRVNGLITRNACAAQHKLRTPRTSLFAHCYIHYMAGWSQPNLQHYYEAMY